MQRGIDARVARGRGRSSLDPTGWRPLGTYQNLGVSSFAISRFPAWANNMRFEVSQSTGTSGNQPGFRLSDTPDNYRAGGTDYGYGMVTYDSVGAGSVPVGNFSYALLSSNALSTAWLCHTRVLITNLKAPSAGIANSIFMGGLNSSGNGQWAMGAVWRTWVGPVYGIQFFPSTGVADIFVTVEASP
jgi:hypothetical protein